MIEVRAEASAVARPSARLLRHLRWLSLVFFVYTAVLTWQMLHRPSTLRVTVELSSSSASIAQLFYDSGSGFSERESRTIAVHALQPSRFEPLTFQFPAYRLLALRFDPTTGPAKVAIKRVELSVGDRIIVRFSAGDLLALNQIASRSETNDAVAFVTAPDANDPQIAFKLPRKLSHSLLLSRHYLVGIVCLDTIFFLLAGVAFAAPQLNTAAATLAKCVLDEEFIAFDKTAILFLGACLTIFIIFSLADCNGSSLAQYNLWGPRGGHADILLGVSKAIRSDEWAYATPDIFNQIFRPDPFAVKDSVLGGHSVALIGNVPVWHFTTLFRPQHWAFFVLPVDYAFAVYWQFKALILLTGVFLWLLLMTRSSWWSIAGSVWFFFSQYTQWCYSWSPGLPEMIGYICLLVVCCCYITTGRKPVALFVASVVAIISVINFALAAYVPHMLPLIWLAAMCTTAWLIAKRRLVFRWKDSGRRLTALGSVVIAVSIVGFLVYVQLKPAITAIAHTLYPGMRAFTGATMDPVVFLTHFMPWTETESHFPLVFSNICEGSGFLWLAPITIFFLSKLILRPTQKWMLLALWVIVVLFASWALFPIPAIVGKLLFLNKTSGTRSLPALGLANMAIVVICMSASRTGRTEVLRLRRVAEAWRAAAIFFGILVAFLLTNKSCGWFFTTQVVIASAAFGGLLIELMIRHMRRVFALALIAANVFFFGLVNPIERGTDVITGSPLFEFVQNHPALLHGKWLVFSDSIFEPGFVAAAGCDLYNGNRFLPDIDHFPLFKSRGINVEGANNLGYLIAREVPLTQSSSFSPGSYPNQIYWSISPLDPVLPSIGIRYLAFVHRPSPDVASRLISLAERPIDGFWLYQLP
jgi:hypothetical protein